MVVRPSQKAPDEIAAQAVIGRPPVAVNQIEKKMCKSFVEHFAMC